MSQYAHSHKRIAQNTLILYVRMLFILGVSLYVARVVLATLGVEDFGIYSVVGGVVTLFSFLSSAMSTATQRFLAFEIGANDPVRLNQRFSQALLLHVALALAVVALAETLGLWFVNTQLNIPAPRMEAARWVYHFSVLTFAVSLLQVPYQANIIARERMSMYAYVSVGDALLKLGVAFVLMVVSRVDMLPLYAFMLFVISVVTTLAYAIYARTQFVECRYVRSRERGMFRELLTFSGWNLFGSAAWVLMSQGLNILLNIFFNPAVNAARAIAFQVNGAVVTFIYNFRTAVNPQIIKAHASGEREYMLKLVFESAKYAYFLMLLLALPVLLETPQLLSIWLTEVPDYAVSFCRLVLVCSLVQCIDISFTTVFQATGKIKWNQILSGSAYMAVFPVSYLLLRFSECSPNVVYLVQLCATLVVSFGIKVPLLRRQLGVGMSYFWRPLVVPVVRVSMVAIALPLLCQLTLPEQWSRMFVTIPLSLISVLVSTYFLGLDRPTRERVRSYIGRFFCAKKEL